MTQVSPRISLQKFKQENPFTTGNAIMLAFIVGLVLSSMVSVDKINELADNEPFHWMMLMPLAHSLILSFLLFLICFAIFRKTMATTKPTEPITREVAIVTVYCLLTAFVFSIASRWVSLHVFNILGVGEMIDIATINDGLLAIAAILITLLLASITRRQQMLMLNEQLQTEQLITRCEALEQQVNPHFLFNSLNTLGGLIGVDDDKARHYLQQLASAYRYVIQHHEHHTVSFQEEMAFTDTYIDMMQTRYGKNLQVVRQINPEVGECRMPPISLQLLVENAIKHNVISERHPLTITLKTTPEGLVSVSNPIQLKQDLSDHANSNHIGLNNLEQRYQMLFHTGILINQTDTEFSVSLPLIQAQ